MFLLYNLAKIDSFKSFQNYISILGLAGTFTKLYFNKIDYKCLKSIAHSHIDLY